MEPTSPAPILKPIVPKPKFRLKLPQKKIVNFLSILLIILVVIATPCFFFVFLPAKQIYSQITFAQKEAEYLKQSIADKNIDQGQQSLDKLKDHRQNIYSTYQKLKFFKFLPYIKDYYQDGHLLLSAADDGLQAGQIVIEAIKPYQDFLGLQAEASSSGQTTQDRIAFLTQSVESLVPHLESINQKTQSLQQSLSQIDPDRYPDEFQGIKIKKILLQAQTTLTQVNQLIKEGQPLLSKISWLMGKDSPRKYFLIFQNDAELRPTGGFWTAYGILEVDNGQITPLASDDIYKLDTRFSSTIPAPRPLKAYHINVPYLNLRDMNLSPDFPTSIEGFWQHYQTLDKNADQIDAVIALDTQVLVDLVEVLGRVGVPGFGNFSADPDKRCDGCPQIIYQLEWIAGRPRNYIEPDRKGFLAPLMHSLLSNAMGSEKEKITPIIQSLLDNVSQKHMLFYFFDPELQAAASAVNLTGDIKPTPDNTDYLHLNDANMASAKTNLFIQQKIKHEIIVKDGAVNHKVIISYQNPSKASNCNLEKGDLCLNAPKYRNWFRFYTPKGSTLIKMTGSEIEAVQYEELGKQVFEGFYGDKYPLYAESSIKTSIQYQSSTPPGPDYSLMLQKQPGTKPIPYQLIVNGQEYQSFTWTGDRTIKIPL